MSGLEERLQIKASNFAKFVLLTSDLILMHIALKVLFGLKLKLKKSLDVKSIYCSVTLSK